MAQTPAIPETITVHLGAPTDASAPNVTVPFPDYIKNVASSEIYPTWPEAAIRANIYAQISFALNRYYTEWYRSQGYPFDITNSTAYDQSYVQGRDIFENIDRIVDEIFNSYLRRPGTIEPLFAAYCDGVQVTCDGLSQWGSVALAEQGLGPYDILTHYYGDNLDLVRGAPVAPAVPSYPGRLIRLGETSNEVRDIQVRLNRISTNYPAIPKIYPVNGVFDQNTLEAVEAFQRIFGLTPDGIVGNATWYRIAYIYTAVKRLAELNSEGLTLQDVSQQFKEILRPGDSGSEVEFLQYYLAVISQYVPEVPAPSRTGVFDEATEQSVLAFQRVAGLTPDGIVGPLTWDKIAQAWRGIYQTSGPQSGLLPVDTVGQVLVEGSSGEEVRRLQEYLNELRGTYPQLPELPVTGYFGEMTTEAVLTAQQLLGLRQTGTVNPVTWEAILSALSDQRKGSQTGPDQFAGYTLEEEES